MVFWGHQRGQEEERGGVPAGRDLPAGGPVAVPPQFLVYKRRLYVLARRPPVLDHRQVMMDSIFGSAEEPSRTPRKEAGRPVRVAVDQKVLRGQGKGGRPVGQAAESRRDREMPRFVPRDI